MTIKDSECVVFTLTSAARFFGSAAIVFMAWIVEEVMSDDTTMIYKRTYKYKLCHIQVWIDR